MDTNFHIFVIITTIITYVLINSRKVKNGMNRNYIYVPFILYGGHYIFNSSSSAVQTDSHHTTVIEELLSEPFPTSTSFSF